MLECFYKMQSVQATKPPFPDRPEKHASRIREPAPLRSSWLSLTGWGGWRAQQKIQAVELGSLVTVGIMGPSGGRGQ